MQPFVHFYISHSVQKKKVDLRTPVRLVFTVPPILTSEDSNLEQKQLNLQYLVIVIINSNLFPNSAQTHWKRPINAPISFKILLIFGLLVVSIRTFLWDAHFLPLPKSYEERPVVKLTFFPSLWNQLKLWFVEWSMKISCQKPSITFCSYWRGMFILLSLDLIRYIGNAPESDRAKRTLTLTVESWTFK